MASVSLGAGAALLHLSQCTSPESGSIISALYKSGRSPAGADFAADRSYHRTQQRARIVTAATDGATHRVGNIRPAEDD